MNTYSIPSDLVVGEAMAAAPAENWAMKLWKVDDLRKGNAGAGVTVAVLDTGVDQNHPDLKDRVSAVKDFTNSRYGAADKHGHGTHCCGTVFAGNPLIGVSTPQRALAGKVLGDSGEGDDGGIAAGIRWALAEGAEIISMSLGSSGPSAAIEAACREAAEAGAWVIAAAGNEGAQGVGYPGGYKWCLSVAAIDRNYVVAPFSSRGKKLDTSGPGVDMVSCRPGGGYVPMSGTSMATPFVAGLMVCVRGSMKAKGMKIPNFEELRSLFVFRSVDLGKPGDDNDYGPGYCNPLLLSLAAEQPPPLEA